MDDPITASALWENQIVFGTENNSIVHFNMDTGQYSRWFTEDQPCHLVFYKGDVLCGFSKGEVARYRKDGTQIWIVKIFSPKHFWSRKQVTDMVEHQNVLYISSHEHQIVSVDPQTGAKKLLYPQWGLEGERYQFPLHRGYVSIYKDTVFLPSKKYIVMGERRHIKVNFQVESCVLSHNKKWMLIQSFSEVCVYSTETWKMRWTKPIESPAAPPIFSDDDTRVIMDHFGAMVVVDTITGVVISRHKQDFKVQNIDKGVAVGFHRISPKHIPLWKTQN